MRPAMKAYNQAEGSVRDLPYRLSLEFLTVSLSHLSSDQETFNVTEILLNVRTETL